VNAVDFGKDKRSIDSKIIRKISVGPSEVSYAADLAECRLDTEVSRGYGLLLAVALLIVVMALYECHQC
jgi:hypothetical protein